VPAEDITVARLAARVLRAAGVDAVYGRPYGDLGVVPVDAAQVADLMATAHVRVHGHPAAIHAGDGVLRIAADVSPTGVSPVAHIVVASVDDLLGAVEPVAAAAAGGEAVEVRIDIDASAPASDVAPPRPPVVDRRVEVDDAWLAALEAAGSIVVLAGPGVVRAGAVPGLHAVAAAGSLGVLNTWGAKGVFDWRSRHHLATAGLQSRDFDLGGLADAALIVATGVDPAEAPDAMWRLAPVLEVAPRALDPLSERWSRSHRPIDVPPLRSGLAAVTQEGWAATGTPLAPTRATLAYGQAVGSGGLVAADPGVAGYWVARTFSTTELGGAQVPAVPGCDGFAVACAVVARLRSPARPVLAVFDGPAREIVVEAVDAAARLGIAVPAEAWQPDGDALDADGHAARLAALAYADRPAIVTLATDPRQLARMVDVAGEVVAWGGLAPFRR
jgi:Thiamine pyrophosphate enzyme, central domain